MKTLDHLDWQQIISIEPDGEDECVCIEVTHPSKCYITDDGIVTHNTTVNTPSLQMGAAQENPNAALQDKAIRGIDEALYGDSRKENQQRRRGHTGNDARSFSRAALQDERRNKGAGGAREELARDTGATRREEAARLVDYARDNGFLIEKMPEQWKPYAEGDVGGQEHHVWIPEQGARVIKLTTLSKRGADIFGMNPVPYQGKWDLDTKGATAYRYLQRLEDGNQTFGDDHIVHGVWNDRGDVHLLTSQRAYDGELPSNLPEGLAAAEEAAESDRRTQDVAEAFAKQGFVALDNRTYYRPSDNTAVFDAHLANVMWVTGKSGVRRLVPFDVTTMHPVGKLKENLAQAAQAVAEPQRLYMAAAQAADELARINREAGAARVIKDELEEKGQPAKQMTGVKESAAAALRGIFAGKFDKMEAAARGLGDLVRGNDIEQHFSEAALNDYMDKVRQSVKESFGSPSYWHNRQNRKRLQRFSDTLLPVAARLNATGIDPTGFTFSDFDMRVGTIFESDLKKMNAKPGDMIPWKGASGMMEMLKVGPLIMDQGVNARSSKNGRYTLLRHMAADTQQIIYDHFKQEFPEGAAWLDQWIDPLLRDATQTGPGNVQVPVFNRHALLKSFNDWSPELKALFGSEPLPGITGMEGYTPDVMAQKGLINSIGAALNGNSYLNRFMSSARKFKAGDLREEGNVKNLFDGFTQRAMESHREKIRLKTRRDIIQKAARPANKVQPEDLRSGLFIPLDDTFKKLYEAHVIASGLDRAKFPVLTQSLNPDQKSALQKLFADMYQLYGNGMVIHRDIHRQLVLGAAMTQTENSLTKALSWIIGRRNRNVLVELGTYANNWRGNFVLQPVELMNRVNLAIVNGLTAPFSSKAKDEGELAARQVAELFKGFFADRRIFDLWTLNNGLGAGIGKIRPFVPQEVFGDGSNLRYDEDFRDKSVLGHLKNLDVGAAFLQGIRYGNIDTHPKMSNTYRLLRAEAAHVAARQKIPNAKREAFINDWMLNAHKDNPLAFLRAFKASQSRFMDYENVPSWMDPTQSALPLNASDNARHWEKLLKSATFPFIRWNYNMMRQVYHQSFGALINATQGAQEGDWSKVRSEVANLMTTAALTGVASYLIGGGGGDDDKELSLGTNQDAEGKYLPKQLRSGSRLNWASIMRRLTGKPATDDYSVEGLDHSANDLWYRYKQDPWLPQAIILGLLARGRADEAYKAAGDLGTDYFLSFGVIGNTIPGLRAVLNPYTADQNYSYAATGTAIDLAISPLVPTRLIQHISKIIDPVTRQEAPRVLPRSEGKTKKGWEDYQPGPLEALKMRIPGMSKDLPAAGTLTQGEAGNFDPEAWLRNKTSTLRTQLNKGLITKEQFRQAAGDAVNQAKELAANKLSPPQVEKLYADMGINQTPDDKKRVSGVPMIPELRTLQDLGVGKESVRTYVSKDSKGRDVTKITAPSPDTITVADPRLEILKALTGINVSLIPTGRVKAAVQKGDFYKTPWKPKQALTGKDWFKK